ncbi:nmrA-like family domain-containing protein 1 [Protopterus annectens]|uniref:nmrA-like family domain-containing protein 1 n=1 Tax=Protopterus annectens TaxID=7888 RepID=UPI001CF98C80|nr:nmrA-like family domain-containing protein 1 [Protopterus annectens]
MPLFSGLQGGAVTRGLLAHSSFKVKAVTRDPNKPSSKALEKLGAEVVKGDLDDRAVVESILKGSYGAFFVTNFFDHFSKEKEVKQGKMLADISKELGLKHVIFSGVENVNKITGGKLEVLHFDGKGEVEEYFWEQKVPMTSVRIAAYYENFLSTWKPVKAIDGNYYVLAIPMGDVPLDGISVADIGPAIANILDHPSEYIGKWVGLSAEALTIEQYASVLSKHMGKTVKDAKITMEAYEKLGFPGAEELANMFRFNLTRPQRDVSLTHKLIPNVRTFDKFIADNKEAFKHL